jgi:hypothetical protein
MGAVGDGVGYRGYYEGAYIGNAQAWGYKEMSSILADQ